MADKFFVPWGTGDVVAEVAGEVAHKTEECILSQLNELISRGLLIVASTQPILVRDPNSTKLIARVSVSLKLKDQEYIESLERQVKELNDLVSTLRGKT